jgi:gliding motility-associated-like protein
MKTILKCFILLWGLGLSLMSAQVAAPDLRCLEVLPNGNVKLSWLPVQDPGNFYSYEIYHSTQRNGPFTQVISGLTSVSTSSVIHTTTSGSIQSCYYYMVFLYGPGGASTSAPSKTLQTIFLNIFPGNVALDLRFSQLHVPALPSSAATYTINKEYPIGTRNILGVTSSTVYPDTIDVCLANINYQITLMDASGCQSASNLIEGTYHDSKSPEEPYVDSISVLPNGYTALSWQIPLDRDIDKYVIQYLVGNLNQPIDVVPGRSSTSYTYTTPTATMNSVGLFVQAEDSCNKGGTVNYQLRTMFLQTSYDRCAYQTRLNWNHYHWPDINGRIIETLGEYRIYYSVDGGPFTQVGSTTDNSFVHRDVSPGKNICYFIRVINARQTVTASSNRHCFFSDQVAAPDYNYMKTATVTGPNSTEVRIYLDNSKSSQGLTVQRSENGTDYSPIGFIPYSGAAHYTFVDEQAEPSVRSYTYRTVVVDSCGNERSSGNTAGTILLKVRDDEAHLFTRHLSWNAYQGFGGGVSGYNVYRVINGEISGGLIGSTDRMTTHFTDNLEDAASRGASIEYLVEAVEGLDNPYGIMERSYSNPVNVYMEGRIFVPNAFAPEGINKTWKPVTHFIEKTDYRVTVFNRWGQQVFETRDDETGWDGQNCPSGVYVYQIHYKNARGEYMELRGTLMLLR